MVSCCEQHTSMCLLNDYMYMYTHLCMYMYRLNVLVMAETAVQGQFLAPHDLIQSCSYIHVHVRMVWAGVVSGVPDWDSGTCSLHACSHLGQLSVFSLFCSECALASFL